MKRKHPTYKQTLPLHLIQDRSVSYALNFFWMEKMIATGLNLEIFYPSFVVKHNIPKNNKIVWIESDHPFFDFAFYHNLLHENQRPSPNCISPNVKLAETCIIGNEGMRYAKSKTGKIISLYHIGNVIIKQRVVIGEHSSIARATFSSTVIEEDTKIGCGVQIGHNCQIGKRNMIIDGSVLLGSVKTGNDCFIGGNSVIRNGVIIPDNTFIGMGSVVTNIIAEPGYIWMGNPAKKYKKWNGEI